MYGGYPTPAATLHIIRDSNIFELAEKQEPLVFEIADLPNLQGQKEKVYPSARSTPFKTGDLFCVQYWGGGGSGDPIERSTEMIAGDLSDGLATSYSVSNVNCAKVDPETFEIDKKATEEMRDRKRKERLARGVPGRVYVRMMVEKREKRNLPEPVLNFLDEVAAFSEAFKKELEFEAAFAGKEDVPIPSVSGIKERFAVTPYIDLADSKEAGKVLICSQCGNVYCKAEENFKLHCLIYDRDPAEIYPGDWAPDKDWMIFREFYCPGCGAQVEVEGTPEGTPIVHSIELDVA